MNDEYIYQYPSPEYVDVFENSALQATVIDTSTRKKVLLFFSIGVAFLGLYCIPIFSSVDTYFLLISAVMFVITIIMMKGITTAVETHNLMIQATESDMVLTYYAVGKTPKRVLKIRYEDIIDCTFFDKTYTKIQFSFKKNEHTYLTSFNRSGDEIPNTNDNLVSFELNPRSYEQGFFLYIAPDYFNIKKYAITDKILKEYGNKNEYFSALSEVQNTQ